MASEIKSDKLSPSTGTALQIGDASDTITIPTGATFTITDGLGVGGGGTGLTSFTAGDVLYATGTTTLAKLAKGTAEQILSMNSGATAPEWTTAAATAGGTGQTGFTAGDILYANSTTTLTKLAKGTGLQGLQTNSGATAPEWVNSPQSLMTAAGDILYASGANTLAKLAKGSDDEVLTLASGVPSWAAAAGGGKIGQVLQTVNTSTETLSSVTMTTIPNFTVTITPAATSSKILIMPCIMMGEINGGYTWGIDLFRDTTQIYMGDTAGARQRNTMSGQFDEQRDAFAYTAMYLDSPSTTSAVAYSLKWNCESAAAIYLNRTHFDDDGIYDRRCASSITAMEVLA
jgi:hypothetical protein